MNLALATISKILLPLLLLSGCFAFAPSDQRETVESRPIAYPFYETTDKLGSDGKPDRIVIKSLSQQRELSLEIPGDADSYAVEMPMSEFDKVGTTGGEPGASMDVAKATGKNPVLTDREMTAGFPQISESHAGDIAILDRSLGVIPVDPPTQSPSYTLGLARIKELYKKREYELALIELNNLITFFPTSARLHMMKGTAHLKMQNFELALNSWKRAVELQPRLDGLDRAIKRLEARIIKRSVDQKVDTPQAPPVEKAPAH